MPLNVGVQAYHRKVDLENNDCMSWTAKVFQNETMFDVRTQEKEKEKEAVEKWSSLEVGYQCFCFRTREKSRLWEGMQI